MWPPRLDQHLWTPQEEEWLIEQLARSPAPLCFELAAQLNKQLAPGGVLLTKHSVTSKITRLRKAGRLIQKGENHVGRQAA